MMVTKLSTLQQALREPIGRPLLSEIARPNWRVTIAFDDLTVPWYNYCCITSSPDVANISRLCLLFSICHLHKMDVCAIR